MKKRSVEFWASTLGACQADPAWAPTFSEFFQGEVFSSGDQELVPFLANIIHESGGLRDLEENLNYSAQRLTEVWKDRFPTLESAQPYARNPQALAVRVYGGRFGNQSRADAWNYRGSGLIMVTFKANFQTVENATGMPVVANPGLLRVPGPAALKAAWAWWEKKVPDGVIGNTKQTRKVVNGGEIGLAHVTELTKILTRLLA